MYQKETTEDDYSVVLKSLRNDINNDVYKRNERLHTTYELAKKYNVSMHIIEKVIEQLIEENLISRRLGNDLFVTQKPMYASGIEELGSVSAMIKSANKVPGTQFIDVDVVSPSENDMLHFNVDQLGLLTRVERVRTADHEPVVYCIDKVCQDLIPAGLVHGEDSMFELIKKQTGKTIHYAKTQIEAVSFHEKVSATLNCRPDQALLLLRQMHYTEQHEPILYSVNYFKSDAFSFHVVRKRIED